MTLGEATRAAFEAPPNPLTQDERKAALALALQALVDVRPQTKWELQWYVEVFYGYRIPDVAVCEGHCSPLDALWDAFTDVSTRAIWIGPRTGGKTLQFAILDHLCLRFNADTVANVGAVEEQAKKCYSYFEGFCNLPHFRKDFIKTMLSKTFFHNTGMLEILPATINRVNSPHPRRAHWDEIELTSQQIIDEGKSMPVRTHGRPPAEIFTSSRKKAHGPMETMLKNRRKTGHDLYAWCVFEIMEQCPEERHRGGEGCVTCPLAEICREKDVDPAGGETVRPGPGKAARANGWMKFEDVVAKYMSISWEVFRAQWLSLRPETGGLVYPQFDENIHVIREADFKWNRNFPTAEGIDFGFINPSVCVFVQALPNDDLVIFDEIYVTQHTAEQFAALIKAKPWFRKTNVRVADPANAGDRQTLANHGVPNEPADKSQKKGESSVENGIQLVRWLLKPPGRRPLLYVTDNCVHVIDEFQSYHIAPPTNPDEKDPLETPSKVKDHAMDGIRYLFTRLFRGQLSA